VRDLVTKGRVLLAVEKYKKGDASLGKAAQVAGLSVGQMMTLLAEFGVESRIEKDEGNGVRGEKRCQVVRRAKPACSRG